MSECHINVTYEEMTRQKASQYNEKDGLRGWEALEIMLKERGVSGAEMEEARQSFYKGIETLSKMFLTCYLAEKNERGQDSGIS